MKRQSRIGSFPVVWNGQSLTASVSGGFVQHQLAHDAQNPLVDAIRWVDAALYVAKNGGRGRIEKVTSSEEGTDVLKGQRPIDMAQLLDWKRHGYVVIDTIVDAKSIG